MTQTVSTDKLGSEVKLGDYAVHRAGGRHSSWSEGIITKITPRGVNLDVPSVRTVPFSLKWLTIPAMLLIVYGAIMPDRDTAVKMVAAYGIQEVATNKDVQQFAGNSLKVVEKFMGDYINESQSIEEITKDVSKKVDKVVDDVSKSVDKVNTEKLGETTDKVLDTAERAINLIEKAQK